LNKREEKREHKEQESGVKISIEMPPPRRLIKNADSEKDGLLSKRSHD
jgi:hypothetical protein